MPSWSSCKRCGYLNDHRLATYSLLSPLQDTGQSFRVKRTTLLKAMSIRNNTLMRSASILAIGVSVSLLFLACGQTDVDMSEPDPTSVEHASAGITSWAVQLVREYLETKPWGFFGATCEQWLDIDYLVAEPTATIGRDGRVHISLDRHPDRALGPESVMYFVDLDTAEVVGDHSSDDGRFGTTEGCDKW